MAQKKRICVGSVEKKILGFARDHESFTEAEVREGIGGWHSLHVKMHNLTKKGLLEREKVAPSNRYHYTITEKGTSYADRDACGL